ncbi:MAG: aldo/keto reductase [Armatimonadota bacterium]
MLTKKQLGRTGLEVTQLGFGAMEIRGERIWSGRPVADEQAETILNAVLDSGINFIDTANDYGKSERYIGQYISCRRNEYYLATKCGCTIVDAGDHDETPHIWTRDNLLRNIEESLTLMQTARVDIWQLHNPPVETVLENDLIEVMQDVKAQGLTQFIGVSTTLPHLPEYIKLGVFDTFQIPYSALERKEEESITAAGEAGIGIIIRGGVAKGVPANVTQSAEDHRAEIWRASGLDELLEPGQSRMDFILRFTLTHPYCHSTIVGTLYPEHLSENIEAANRGPLSAEVYEAAKSKLDTAGIKPERLTNK